MPTLNKTGRRYPGLTNTGVALTHAWLKTLDAELAELERRGRTEGLEIACRPGCAACCTYLVGALPSEAALVVDHIDRLPSRERDAIIARLVAWERAWLLAGGRDLVTPQAALVWQDRRIPCPMLDPKSYTCTVYPVRPLACRAHHALPAPTDEATRVQTPFPCCGTPEPGDGCFQTPQATRHGHPVATYMLDNLLLPRTNDLIALLEGVPGASDGKPQGGHLPTLVLRIGRVERGWQNPPKVVKLPVLQHATTRR
jgi:Fe-S-cluster containining protein